MNIKRMRGRNHRPNNGGGGGGFSRNQQNGIPLNRNHVFDSSGPEMRVRGTAQQLFDKYTQMARDASSSGDRVLGEAYYQHAEHYFRIISAINQAQGVPNPPQNGQNYAQGGEGENEQQQQQQQPRPENRQEQQPRHDNQNRQEYRQDRPERSENRDNNRQDNRDNRNNDGNRQDRPRFEQRPRPEFQQRDRGDRPFRQPQPPIAEAPIDISSALEAELTAAVAEPPGLSEQPQIRHAIQHELLIPSPPAPAPAAAPAPEPRAIPISTKAPPPPPEEPAAPVPTRRPRGRPKLVKAETPSE